MQFRLRRCGWGIIAAVVVAGVVMGQTGERVTLPAVRWGAMPANVTDGRVGADGRVWWQLRVSPRDQPMTVDQVKEMIVREAATTSPELEGVSPVLFEASGRSWFLYTYAVPLEPEGVSVLLGYDGKTWAMRERAGRSIWWPLGQVSRESQPMRAVGAGGSALFSITNGVERWDGKDWSTEHFVVDGMSVFAPPTLLPEGDGLGALAVVTYAKAPAPGAAQTGGRWQAVWRFRDGTWKQVEGLGVPNSLAIRGAAASARGIWAMVGDLNPQGGSLGNWRMQFVSHSKTTLNEWVKALAADDFRKREAATDEILSRGGEGALAMVTTALAGAEATEAKYRLENIRAKLERTLPQAGVAASSSNVAGFEITAPVFLTTMADGRAILRARMASGPERTQLVTLLMGTDGSWSKIGVGDAESRMFTGLSGSFAQEPLPVAGGSRLWINDGTGPARLIDLPARKVVQSFPLSSGDRLVGPTSEGRVLVAGSVMKVFSPEAPDPRGVLGLDRIIDASTTNFAVGPDNSLWAGDVARGLVRLEKAGWVMHERLMGIKPTGTIVGGKDDVVLCETASGWTLVTREHVWSEPNLEPLIAAHADVVRAAFKGVRIGRLQGDSAMVAVDSRDNLWLWQARTRDVRIFREGKWAPITQDITRLGHGRLQISGIAPVAGGRQILVIGTASQSFYLLAHLENDAVVLTLAGQPSGGSGPMPRPLYTKDGSLWLEMAEQPAGRGKPSAVRIGAEGVADRIVDVSPVLVDAGDGLWVRPVRRQATTPEWAIVRNGKTSPVELPANVRRLVPVGAGRIIAWTDGGLVELKGAEEKWTASEEKRLAETWQPIIIEPAGEGRAVISGMKIDGSGWNLGVVEGK